MNNTLSKKRKLALVNSSLALLAELVSVISGFVLPRLILKMYGSSYNGLVSSASQFLSCIILLNGGVGGVTRAALYKALANHDTLQISRIVNATQKYLRKICFVFLFILFAIAIILPFSVVEEFPDWSFVFTLVLILGINYFARYFVSLSFQMLLVADQKQYIRSCASIATTILSTILSAVLILSSCDIRIVKLVAALVFVCGALFVRFYTIKKYKINTSVEGDNTAIKQRWDAFAHTAANYIHANTDLVILTFFTNTLELSVYAVHYLAINGIKHLFEPINTAIEGFLGNVYMQEKRETFLNNFGIVEVLIFSSTFICFTCCSIALPYFAGLYTVAANDATEVNYIRPVFATIACFAEMLYCMRIPYQTVVQATGHFKETRNGAILEAVLNIAISLILVQILGMVGVAIGTLVAMCIRTVQYAYFTTRKIIGIKMIRFWIRLASYGGVYIIYNLLAYIFKDKFMISNWFIWAAFCIILILLLLITSVVIEMLLDKNSLFRFFRYLRSKFFRTNKV